MSALSGTCFQYVDENTGVREVRLPLAFAIDFRNLRVVPLDCWRALTLYRSQPIICPKSAMSGKPYSAPPLAFISFTAEDLGAYRRKAADITSVNDGKPRLISAAPFRERVVHHALLNVLGPCSSAASPRSSAYRKGIGTHRARAS